jgi:hypothetical protein
MEVLYLVDAQIGPQRLEIYNDSYLLPKRRVAGQDVSAGAVGKFLLGVNVCSWTGCATRSKIRGVHSQEVVFSRVYRRSKLKMILGIVMMEKSIPREVQTFFSAYRMHGVVARAFTAAR